jgi:hypothetical protein
MSIPLPIAEADHGKTGVCGVYYNTKQTKIKCEVRSEEGEKGGRKEGMRSRGINIRTKRIEVA